MIIKRLHPQLPLAFFDFKNTKNANELIFYNLIEDNYVSDAIMDSLDEKYHFYARKFNGLIFYLPQQYLIFVNSDYDFINISFTIMA